MSDIIKIFFDKLTKFFWQSIFCTSITLWLFAKYKPEIFNYQLFENKSGIAQALLTFIIILSAYYLFISILEKFYISISDFIYDIIKNSEQKAIQEQQLLSFIEALYNKQLQNPLGYNYHKEGMFSNFLLFLYNNQIRKFKSDEIYNLCQNIADEKQKHAENNVLYAPVLSQQQCIECQNFFNSLGFLTFDGTYYHVKNMLFEKLNELKSRGMLEQEYLRQVRKA